MIKGEHRRALVAFSSVTFRPTSVFQYRVVNRPDGFTNFGKLTARCCSTTEGASTIYVGAFRT